MSKYKVGDVVKILDDGAWNGVVDNKSVSMFDYNLSGTFAEIVQITQDHRYVLKLEANTLLPFNVIEMDQETADDDDEYLVLHKPASETKPVKSDGGSSSYYDIPLPEWLVGRIIDRQSDGEAFIKTEEIITVAFGNDFDYGNLFKSEVRAWGAMNGAGKEGNSVGYELNKMRYSIDKIQEAVERGE